ncbi:MAG: polyphosphate polymerase domain-containing protein [Sedimentisphaerales bacterium]
MVKKDIPRDIGADRTLWCRYEMKYVISESKAAAVARFIEPHLKVDRYSVSRPNYAYPIVSLYIDSDDLRLCLESLGGLLNRFKLRVRSYSDEPESPQFFEIKRRANTVIIKSRARVTPHDVAALLSGQYVPPLQNHKTEVDAIKQFQLYMKNVGAKPKVLIRYMRQAYESDTENRVRVTFDRQLAYKVSQQPQVLLGGRGWQYNPVTLGGGVILEIKFTGRYPPWLCRMVQYLNLQQQPVSKYTTSIIEARSLGFCAPQVPLLEAQL